MFIYSFQTEGTFLISHFVVSGEHLTIYFNKESSLELQPLINHFKLTGIRFAEDPRHLFLHNPFVEFSKQGDNVPHKHLKFHLENRLESLTQICQFLLNRQEDINLRTIDFINLCDDLDTERKDYGDTKLPNEIRQSLAEYDYKIPYLPQNEIPILLTEFSTYLQSDGFLKKAENLAVHAEKVLKKNWTFLYEKLLFGNPETKNEMKLKEYYDEIISLRFILLKISELQKIEDYAYSNEIAQSILKNPYIKSADTTGEDLSSIQSDLQGIIHTGASRIKSYERKNGLIFAAMVALGIGISELYLYYSTNLASDSFPYSRTGMSLIVAGTLGYVLNKPVAYAGFFAKKMIRNNSAPGQRIATTDNDLPINLSLFSKSEPEVKYHLTT